MISSNRRHHQLAPLALLLAYLGACGSAAAPTSSTGTADEALDGSGVANDDDSHEANVVVQVYSPGMKCSGTLITPQIVLTSAHCVWGDADKACFPQIHAPSVRVGHLWGQGPEYYSAHAPEASGDRLELSLPRSGWREVALWTRRRRQSVLVSPRRRREWHLRLAGRRPGRHIFMTVIGGGDGVLYAVETDGTLRWYRHYDWQDANVDSRWADRTTIGSDWDKFLYVFSTGGGIIYGVKTDGSRLWYNHDGYLSGAAAWQPPKQVGTGWNTFKQIYSAGNGSIYAVQFDGTVLWYQHIGWKDGSWAWRGPVQVQGGWDAYARSFALLEAAAP